MHSEIDRIVDSAFNNMLQSAESAAALDIDSKQKETERWAAVGRSHSSANERHSRESLERGQRPNFQKERQRSADTAQHRQEAKLKGDETDDDMSLKQWKEQRRKMDLHKESLHDKTTGTPSAGISNERMPHPHRRPSETASDESVADDDTHERVVARSSTESKDVGNRHPDSVDVDSDENDVEASSHSGNSDEARDGSHNDPDLPESPAIENDAITDDADHADSQNMTTEQSPKADDGEDLMTAEMTAANAAGESKEGVLMSEELVGKETFEEESDGGAEDVAELTEILHKSSADHDEDEMQTAPTSEPGSVEENAAADDDDDDAVVHESTNTENDESDEHSDVASRSGDDNEALARSEDEDIPPVNVDDSNSADIEPDDVNTDWTFSPLTAICSFIEAIIDMVRCKTFL